MEVNKVLWPTDFSSSAEKALPYVSDLTQKYQAEIHCAQVLEKLQHHPWVDPLPLPNRIQLPRWRFKWLRCDCN